MGRFFSKDAFLRSDSGRGCRRLLNGHLDSADGMPVQYASGDPYGMISYELNGEQFELYPAMPEWCREEFQTSLFGGTQ